MGAGAWIAVERHHDMAARRLILLNAMDTLRAFFPEAAFRAELAAGRVEHPYPSHHGRPRGSGHGVG